MFLSLLGTAGVGFLGFIAVKLQNIEVTLAVAVKTQEQHTLDIKDLQVRMRDVEINL